MKDLPRPIEPVKTTVLYLVVILSGNISCSLSIQYGNTVHFLSPVNSSTIRTSSSFTGYALPILILIFSAVSCQNERGAYELLSSFVHAYRAEGIVYSSYANEGEEGYIDRELFDKIYVHSGRVPDDFSIFLASHTDSYSECGVFNCRDAQM